MKSVGVFFVILFCSVFLPVGTAGALGWTDETPTVHQDIPTIHTSEPVCPTFYQDISIEGFSDTRRSCQFGGVELEISRFVKDDGKSALAVKAPLGHAAHLLEGVCSNQARCLYSPEQDLLVTNFPIASSQLGVEIFRRVRDRVKATIDPIMQTVRYTFDASNPDYIFHDTQGTTLSARAFALSDNGKWLAIELKDHGTAIVDTTDLTARRVIPTGPEYGVGFDPTVEMAVSNDGSSVVVAGQNASFLIVDVREGCGEPILKKDLSRQPPAPLVCPTTQANLRAVVSPPFTVFQPRFDNSGSQLTFLLAPKLAVARFITLRSASFDSPDMEYIALGDSFSSGEGETDDRYYAAGTNQGFDRCHVSSRSYPFLVSTAMGTTSEQVGNVACSGAKLIDVTADSPGYLGQANRLGPKGLNLSETDRLQESRRALEEFVPGRIGQSLFIDYYHPKVATIGIGGNDAGLMTKLRSCAMPGTCEWASLSRRSQVVEEIRSLFDPFVKLFTNLNALSPATRLYAIGYPRVVEPLGTCDPITALLFDRDERIFMDESIRYLNDIVEAAASKVGIAYLDIEDSYGGQRLCGDTRPTAMNGLRVGDDTTISSTFPMLRLVGNETFHPNPIGHQLASATITARYGDLRSREWCPDSRLTCPATVSVPNPPDYWTGGGGLSATLRQVDFAFSEQAGGYGYQISLPERNLRPDSEVRIEVHSDSVPPFALRVGDDGALEGSIGLPPNLTEGIHTLHLYATDYEGQPAELYQEIVIGSVPEPDEEEVTTPPDSVPPATTRTTGSSNPGSPTAGTGEQVVARSESSVLGSISFPVTPLEIPSETERTSSDSWTFTAISVGCFALAILLILIVLWRWKAWHGT